MQKVEMGLQKLLGAYSQVQFEWSNLICSNEDRDGKSKPPGEHWCICMWATERMINKVLNPNCTNNKIILLKIWINKR